MCRMMGITNFNFQTHRNLIDGFFELARTGKILEGDEPGHLDGWGLGYYKNGTARVHKSSASLLTEESFYYDLLHAIGTTPILIIHLRKSAWKDTTTVRHAHPFLHNNCFFVHNGTVRDYQKLLSQIPEENQPPVGTLDTEVYFRFILGVPPLDLSASFKTGVEFIKEHTTFSSLSCLFSEGKSLYAYREFSKYPEYYSLYRATVGNSTVISSEPLSPSLQWTSLDKGEMMVVKP